MGPRDSEKWVEAAAAAAAAAGGVSGQYHREARKALLTRSTRIWLQ